LCSANIPYCRTASRPSCPPLPSSSKRPKPPLVSSEHSGAPLAPTNVPPPLSFSPRSLLPPPTEVVFGVISPPPFFQRQPVGSSNGPSSCTSSPMSLKILEPLSSHFFFTARTLSITRILNFVDDWVRVNWCSVSDHVLQIHHISPPSCPQRDASKSRPRLLVDEFLATSDSRIVTLLTFARSRQAGLFRPFFRCR